MPSHETTTNYPECGQESGRDRERRAGLCSSVTGISTGKAQSQRPASDSTARAQDPLGTCALTCLASGLRQLCRGLRVASPRGVASSQPHQTFLDGRHPRVCPREGTGLHGAETQFWRTYNIPSPILLLVKVLSVERRDTGCHGSDTRRPPKLTCETMQER